MGEVLAKAKTGFVPKSSHPWRDAPVSEYSSCWMKDLVLCGEDVLPGQHSAMDCTPTKGQLDLDSEQFHHYLAV